MADIEPFHVMDLLARSRELEAAGRSIVHMEIGEPDFSTPGPIIEAGIRALEQGKTHYTPAVGLPLLRERLAAFYESEFGVQVDAGRIVITPGASGALQLLMGVLIDPGQSVMLADPGYPCNRHFVRLVEGRALSVPVDAGTAFQLTPEIVRAHWDESVHAVMLASPSNPTGTSVPTGRIRDIAEIAAGRNAHVIVDEIYQHLVYGRRPETALSVCPDLFVVNSFSKYFGMTGWRLGWLVAPEAYVRDIDKLAQNIFLAAPTPAQHAALAAFDPDTRAILEARRETYRERRDFLLRALRETGFGIPAEPDGAFYLYADCSAFGDDSYRLAVDLLEQAGVAVTPGIDFGSHRAKQYLRFAWTTSMEQLEEGVERIRRFVS